MAGILSDEGGKRFRLLNGQEMGGRDQIKTEGSFTVTALCFSRRVMAVELVRLLVKVGVPSFFKQLDEPERSICREGVLHGKVVRGGRLAVTVSEVWDVAMDFWQAWSLLLLRSCR